MSSHISFVNIFELFQFFRVDSSHRLGEITINLTISKVDALLPEFFENPWENIVLVDIIVSSSTIFIEKHEIVKV